MPLGPRPTTTGTASFIQNLDWLLLQGGQSTWGIPYNQLGSGLTYMQNMQYAVFSDDTEVQETQLFDTPALCLLGDIWGSTAGKEAPGSRVFGGTAYGSQIVSQNTRGKLWYQVSGDMGSINESFGQEPFYQFGRLAFAYPGPGGSPAYGPSHWLEHTSGVCFSEASDPIGFALYLKKGLIFTWYVDNTPSTVGAGVNIAGTVNSAVTGVLTGFGTN